MAIRNYDINNVDPRVKDIEKYKTDKGIKDLVNIAFKAEVSKLADTKNYILKTLIDLKSDKIFGWDLQRIFRQSAEVDVTGFYIDLLKARNNPYDVERLRKYSSSYRSFYTMVIYL